MCAYSQQVQILLIWYKDYIHAWVVLCACVCVHMYIHIHIHTHNTHIGWQKHRCAIQCRSCSSDARIMSWPLQDERKSCMTWSSEKQRRQTWNTRSHARWSIGAVPCPLVYVCVCVCRFYVCRFYVLTSIYAYACDCWTYAHDYVVYWPL